MKIDILGMDVINPQSNNQIPTLIEKKALLVSEETMN